MEAKTLVRNMIFALGAAGLAGGYVYSECHSQAHAQNSTMSAQITAPVNAPTLVQHTQATDFSSIVERFGPAVVNISVTSKTPVSNRAEMPEMDPNDPFFEFFRHFGPQMPHGDGGFIQRGQGSGFIIRADGLILTNAHVVDGAQEVVVKLTDRREFKAKVIGTDRQSDVAVIKIEAKDLPTVIMGDPNQTKVGEPVLAIGSPFGFENTATAGIVSAKARALPDDPYVSFMQTDVAVNPGNSGGPLFNLRGEVIGINSQIFSRTGGYQGLSFAIPIDVANKVQTELVAHGKVARGRLGVAIQEVNQGLADSFGLSKPQGALVSSVEKGSPADKAGIQAGDVITAMNGHTIEHSSDLSAFVANLKPGSDGKLDIIRKGKSMTLSVNVGELKSASVAANDDNNGAHARLGVSVRPLDPREQQRSGIDGGLVVEQVGGPAARAGIQRGDVILSVNGTAVDDPKQLKSMVEKAGKSVALLIQRNDSKIFIPVDLG